MVAVITARVEMTDTHVRLQSGSVVSGDRDVAHSMSRNRV
jgi:hypothetical protein